MADIPHLALPPRTTTADGKPRRIGVELEMSGLTIDRLTRLAADFLHAKVESDGRYQRVLTGDPAGEWIVELDFHYLKQMGREEHDTSILSGELRQSAEDVLRWLAETVVPLELVSPPLPMTRLSDVEQLITLLRDAGAKGSSDHPVNAFGMQFNPEIPDAGADTIAAYLKAFLCLYDWLLARSDIDFTRRLTAYIDPFPLDYLRLATAPDYHPDMATLIDDYLQWNPTRNRALDMLPLFLHLDEARVRAVTADPLIKPRPTFHYRLPDCEIHLPEWGLDQAWNDWLQVERLACDAERLRDCCTAFHAFQLRPPLERWMGDWAEDVETRWLAR